MARIIFHRLKEAIVENLPLDYDDTTLRIIENIDVIWLKGRSKWRIFWRCSRTWIFACTSWL
jgi:hypothetical protein